MSHRSDNSNHAFRVGQNVVAQWPGSKKQYRAKVIKNSPKYELEYEDGTRHKNVPVEAITAVEDVSIRKSPRFSARQKALNEQLARSKSPTSRTSRSLRSSSKSPARKNSPSRTRSSSRNSKKNSKMEVNVKVNRGYTESPGGKEELLDISASVGNSTMVPPINTQALNNKMELRKRMAKNIVEDDNIKSTKAAAIQSARVAGAMAPIVMCESENVVTKTAVRSCSSVSVGEHFGSSFGTFFLTLTLPFLVFYLNWVCTPKGCTLTKLPTLPSCTSAYFSLYGSAIFLGWLIFQAILYALPIGRVAYGQPLRDGRRLPYRINGFLAFAISMFAVTMVLINFDVVDIVYNNYIQMLTTSIIVTYVLSIILGLKARSAPVYDYALPDGSTSCIYDFFMGKELNPRLSKYFDIKMFLELRPGVIGWGALNVCFLYKDYQDNGSVSTALAVSAACQLLYVADALLFEKALLTTMDITTEGLGFMLIFGNLTFVPFIFTLESRFLLMHGRSLPVQPCYLYVGIVCLNFLGYFIFRASNLQKNAFRRNRFGPTVSNLATISTGLPSEILAGGWWGFLRHPNYLGDIMMAISWCIPCGFSHIIPYTYAIYLTVVLLHRALRDDDFCQAKYGDAWHVYCKRVPSRIIPRVF